MNQRAEQDETAARGLWSRGVGRHPSPAPTRHGEAEASTRPNDPAARRSVTAFSRAFGAKDEAMELAGRCAGAGPRARGASLAAALLLAVAACGGSDEPAGPATSGDAASSTGAVGAAGAKGTDPPASTGSQAPPAAPAGQEPARPDAPPPPLLSTQGPWLDAAELAALPAAGPDLVNEAVARGLDYVNVCGAPDKPYILDANGAGVAALDLGSDGDTDLVFGQGVASLAALLAGPGARLEVFENDGAGRFARVAAERAPDARGFWTGLAAGDVDGDGHTDLVAGGYGALLLCRQQDGALRPWTDAPGGGLMSPDAPAGTWLVPGAERSQDDAPPAWTTSLAFVDAELDGDLDLYVGRYLNLDPLAPPRGELGEGPLAFPCWWKGIEVYCGPRGFPAQPDVMLRGDGAGGFEDVTRTWLPSQVESAGGEPGFTLAVGAFDADFDGDSDLYVANDSTANLMLVNEVRGGPNGDDGAFVDRALTAGVAFNPDGAPEAGMGVAFGDVNRDGRLDLAVTNFSDEPTHLYLAREMGFGDVTYKLGLSNETRRLLSWSTHLEDFDGDGRLELFTANGHVYPQADGEATGTRYAQADTLWRLIPNQKVERVYPRRRDSALAVIAGTRGTAQGDFDGDGAPDLVLATIDAPAVLAMNRLAPDPERAHRLVVVLEGDPTLPPLAGADGVVPKNGPRTSRDALGAKAILAPSADFALLKEVQSAVGYQSSSSPHLFFGTGPIAEFQALTIRWPSGRVDEIAPGPMGRRLFVKEGVGLVKEEEL